MWGASVELFAQLKSAGRPAWKYGSFAFHWACLRHLVANVLKVLFGVVSFCSHWQFAHSTDSSVGCAWSLSVRWLVVLAVQDLKSSFAHIRVLYVLYVHAAFGEGDTRPDPTSKTVLWIVYYLSWLFLVVKSGCTSFSLLVSSKSVDNVYRPLLTFRAFPVVWASARQKEHTGSFSIARLVI